MKCLVMISFSLLMMTCTGLLAAESGIAKGNTVATETEEKISPATGRETEVTRESGTQSTEKEVTPEIREADTVSTNEKQETQQQKLNSAHNYFAATLNGEVWQLLEKAERSPAENERMVYAAHASCYHWLHAGTGVNHQRGEWLIARVYTVLGTKDAAVRHAERCFELTETHKDEMKDFDLAYAHEALARAHALAGNRDDAVKHRHLAEKLGNLIAEEEDKKIFMSDFSGGEWYGVK